jgi:hypothetical protein
MVALVLLPQILLCGFFVSVDDLPNWIAWAHWLMPLTYVFRLFITEEFSTCLDFTIDEQYTMNCIRSIDNALGTIESLGALTTIRLCSDYFRLALTLDRRLFRSI